MTREEFKATIIKNDQSRLLLKQTLTLIPLIKETIAKTPAIEECDLMKQLEGKTELDKQYIRLIIMLVLFELGEIIVDTEIINGCPYNYLSLPVPE